MSEFTPSEEVRSGLFPYRSETSDEEKWREITFGVLDGLALFEGDIILGSAADIPPVEGPGGASMGNVPPGAAGLYDPTMPLAGIVVSLAHYDLWAEGKIPYTIDPALLHPEIIEQAIRHWEKYTVLRFPRRTDEENYLSFQLGDGCRSLMGCHGGTQPIWLTGLFGSGTVIHEIGHAVGLWHEQSREDRDDYVTIHPENIKPGCEHNFEQQIAEGDDVGPYDYGSIMHYPSVAFTKNGKDTITPKIDVRIGQRIRLSLGDIAAVNGLYGKGELYVGNTRSKAFHNRHCRWAERIAATNIRYFTAIDDALDGGYRTCGSCFPREEID